jgi:glycosyltransferase involved in cell wall biosynthesis
METRFAVRTRLFDALWARLPIVSTDGDQWSELIRARGLGEIAPPEQPEALAAAARAVVERGRQHYAPALEAMAEEHRWARVAAPLARLIDSADRLPPAVPPFGARLLSARHSTAQRVNRLRGLLGSR